MKLLKTLIILLFTTTGVNAQDHIFGLNAGMVDNFNGNEPTKYGIYRNIEKGVFYRYNSKGRLSLNIGLGYQNYTEQTGPAIIYDAGFTIYNSKYVVDIIDVQASLQYNITPNRFRTISFLKNIDNYVGIVLGHRSSKETIIWYTEQYQTYEKGETRINDAGIEALAGLNYTVSYTINRLVLQSTSTILAGSGDFGEHFPRESDYPSSRLSINFGLGYKLFK